MTGPTGGSLGGSVGGPVVLTADLSPAVLATAVVAALRSRTQTVATAESLTGGLLGATLTDVPGASAVFRGGLIVYATELKGELAGVSASVLATDGPVASSTAAELARGAARVCRADWGLATTGVAGPDPQDGHPVGQVFVAVAGPAASGPGESGPGPTGERAAGERAAGGGAVGPTTEPAGGNAGVEVRELSLSGDRAAIRTQTVAAVLGLLLEHLEADRAR